MTEGERIVSWAECRTSDPGPASEASAGARRPPVARGEAGHPASVP